LAAAGAGVVVAGTAGVGRGDGDGAFAAAVVGRGADAGFAAVPGSGVMILTGGVDAAVGNSALVGRPVGIDDGSATAATAGGAFHTAA
jgi:hypothetical protein